jgi:hypothetical protein
MTARNRSLWLARDPVRKNTVATRRATMSNDLMLDVGQANELKLAFRRADFSNDDIKRLCEGNVLADVRSVLRGHASIGVTEHVIDCYIDPFNPRAKDGWTVEEHRRTGSWAFNPKQVEFFLPSDQMGDRYIAGNELRKKLEKKHVFNANVLDYLIAHPHLIPEEWKKDAEGNTRHIFFWGTIYRHPDGRQFVRYLYCWTDGMWHWGNNWLGYTWNSSHPAAVPTA